METQSIGSCNRQYIKEGTIREKSSKTFEEKFQKETYHHQINMSSFVQFCFALAVCCCMYAAADNGNCKIVSSEWTSTSPNDSSCQRKYTLRHCEAKSCNLPAETGKVRNIHSHSFFKYFCLNRHVLKVFNIFSIPMV